MLVKMLVVKASGQIEAGLTFALANGRTVRISAVIPKATIHGPYDIAVGIDGSNNRIWGPCSGRFIVLQPGMPRLKDHEMLSKLENYLLESLRREPQQAASGQC